MVAYRVRSVIQNSATDILSFIGAGDGFAPFASSASSVTIDAGAHLISTSVGHGLNLAGGAWTVAVNGTVGASVGTDAASGAAVRISNASSGSKITVTDGADIYGGSWGILAEARTSVVNGASIAAAENAAIAQLGGGTITITNTGIIRAFGSKAALDQSGSHALFFSGSGTHTVTNSGTIDGGDVAGSFAILSTSATGVEIVKSTTSIFGDVDLGGGNDTITLTGSGRMTGRVQMGNGNDVYVGSTSSENVVDGGGADVVTFGSGGTNTYFAVRDITTGIDGTDKITGNGTTVYNAANAATDLKINLDAVAHNSIGANSASGSDVGNDAITSIERVKTGAGDDEIWGSKNVESIYAGAGSDVVKSGFGNDKLYGEDGDDSLYGGDGDDVISGGAGIDFIFGGNGLDVIDGGDDNDIVYGELGDDALSGGAGDDTLSGGAGADKLSGGLDGDRLNGGLGRDVLTGGEGHDTFVFSSVLDTVRSALARDVVTDFKIGEDQVDVSAIDARSSSTSVNDAFNWIGMAAYSNVAGQLRFGFSNGNTVIAGDIDGNGKSDFQIQLNGHVFLIDVDFLL